jgi:predicted component of viral defense system (DUF524 family)
MQLLRVEHEDFELLVESNNLSVVFNRARERQLDMLSSTQYRASTGSIFLINPTLTQLEPLYALQTHPVFFENRDYFIGLTFHEKEKVTDAYIHSRQKEVQDKFFYRSKLGFLAGTVNFGNDIGKSELRVRYSIDNKPKTFVLNFEVFPTKLDFRRDYLQIVNDVEQQYPYLVLDFLRKTYSGFKSGDSPNTDLIWWQVFGGLYTEFISASRFILNKPHSRIVQTNRHVRADEVLRWTPRLEERFGEYRQLPQTLYRAEYKTLTANTPENRFFKHAVQRTGQRFKRVKNYITTAFKTNITPSFEEELDIIGKQLDVLSANPFFKAVSAFKGIKQESLVLQKATGYSTILRSWIMLNSGLKFLDGIQRIDLKNIADLYQIWCFLEIKGILQRLLRKEKPDDVELAEIQVDDFVFRIERGVKSRVVFKHNNGDLIELYHDFSFDKAVNKEIRSFTVNQRPDIVLRITRNDLKDNYGLTYLFDAKYRLQSDDRDGAPDLPPDDAINQMHRYRDAIYFHNRERNSPEKEVIGAYVLFPGRGEKEEIKSTGYFSSIRDVNIGAFPLKPNGSMNRELLEEHLRGLVGVDTESALTLVSPQKLLKYEPVNPGVIIGIVAPDKAKYLFDTAEPFYYFGKMKPRFFGENYVKYFAPYIKGRGIYEYFEIENYALIPRNDIFAPGHALHVADDTTERVVLRLGKRHSLPFAHKIIDGSIRYFRYTRLVNLRNPVKGKVVPVTPEDLNLGRL